MSQEETDIVWHSGLSALRGSRAASVLAATLVATGASYAQSATVQPKLVVGIMVDDLRPEYLSLLKEKFSQGGFNRLIKDGVIIPSVDYGTPVDAAAATAMIYTGAAPSANGIPAAMVFDRNTLTPVHVLNDKDAMGNFTTETLSAAPLSMTTISDEVRIAGGGVTYVYAFAAEPAQAIIMAGHAGNCGLWINDANERWATTTFYKDVPSSLSGINRLRPLRVRVDTMQWTPSRPNDDYLLLPDHLKNYPFKYDFRTFAHKKIEAFKISPRGNDEVTDFAIDNLKQLKLGSHAGPDMISVAYTLQPFKYARNTDNRFEILDSYYRLDLNLQRLFSAIDSSVGLDNAIVFLAGTPPSPQTPRDDERWMLPYGEFSTRKAISLLNLYLIAMYGNGEWVQGYFNNQFYLNHKLIEEHKLSLESVRLEAARFLERMSGVAKAYSFDEIIDTRNADMATLKRNTYIPHTGDVTCYVLPGWQIIDDFNVPGSASRTDKVVRATASTAPAFILAPGIKSQKIGGAVDARAIAPTITGLLRIRSPNGAAVPPLNLE